jgi:hypothetical protein
MFSIIGIGLISVFYLSGNIESSHLNSFILAVFLVLGGIQAILMGINIKIYSIIHGYDEKIGWATFFMKYRNLENIMASGGILMLIGIIIGLFFITKWIQSDYGYVSQITTAIWSLLLVLIGLQFIISSIFTSMMLLNDPENNN